MSFNVIGLAILLLSCHTSNAADPSPIEYLADDLADRIVTARQDWGELGRNTAVKPKSGLPLKLRIKDQQYIRGLGQHANGEIVVVLDGEFKTFAAEIGIQWQGGNTVGSVVFQVFVDGVKRFDSDVVRENDPPRHIRVPIKGAMRLKLVATTAPIGDGITCDAANWANARLIRDPDSAARPEHTDMAPFAQVATWNPLRMTGTSASRAQEFPAQDLRLARQVKRSPDGTYQVPLWSGSAERGDQTRVGCIGLEWRETRLLRELSLRFRDRYSIPANGSVRLQYWKGRSPWQGKWVPLETRLVKEKNWWKWRLPFKGQATEKVRWIFPPVDQPIGLAGLEAKTGSHWKEASIRFELHRSGAPKPAHVGIRNGLFLDAENHKSTAEITWNTATPMSQQLLCAVGNIYKTDETVLTFRIGQSTFGVGLDDLLANDGVFVSHAGLFVTRDPAPIRLDAYLRKHREIPTVLQRVCRMPDQTFAQAMAKTHNPVEDLGPMMLSLACDNRKFIAHRDGTISFLSAGRTDGHYPSILVPYHPDFDPTTLTCRQLRPRFGDGRHEKVTRHLEGGWLPIPVTTVDEDGVVYRQRTYVAPVDRDPPPGELNWFRQRAVCVVEYTIENTRPSAAGASLVLTLSKDANKKELAKLSHQVDRGLVAVDGEYLLALVDTRGAAPLDVKAESGVVALGGDLPAGGKARCIVYLPAWKATPNEDALLSGKLPGTAELAAYWKAIFKPAMQVELPDSLLTNVIQASQVHCMLAARNEAGGARVSPWIGADRYGPLESESQAVIRGMDMMGNHEFARRSLEFFRKRQNAKGFLTTGYTLVGTGENLWTLAEHYDRTQDRHWLGRVADKVARQCFWIMKQRAKTKRVDAHGEKVPEYGLMPPGITADWSRFAYRFFNEAQYCAGLREAGRVLAEIDHPAARAIIEDAKTYRADILRAYRWNQARSPVLPLNDGTWVPAYPTILNCFGEPGDFFPGEDSGRSWCYGIEIGAHHLAATSVLDPRSEATAWIVGHMEDVQFLRSGWGDYPEQRNRTDIFDLGGFSKVQPYYTRIAELYAARDDVKPFIRSYFNAIASLLSRENLSFWEHFHNRGGWNKTHETGWFLSQSRIMLVQRRGDELWLAPFVTNQWMKSGMKVSVRNAPSRFGKVSYTITSAADSGRIEAVIEPPARHVPSRIVIRLRHPDGKRIQAVTVNGKPHTEFDAEHETVSIEPTTAQISVCARF